MAKPTLNLALVVHNVRSAHNVGSLLRSADGLGVQKVYLTGYTPFPIEPNDSRLPHLARRTSAAIAKTALGAENSLAWRHYEELNRCLAELTSLGYQLAALEQTDSAIDIADFSSSGKLALVVGNEVSGLEQAVLEKLKLHLKLPMAGQKESFNVTIAAALAIYHLRYLDKNRA